MVLYLDHRKGQGKVLKTGKGLKMKVYEVIKNNSYHMAERVAVFSNKSKAYGFLMARMDDKAVLKDKATGDFLYGTEKRLTVRNLLKIRMVVKGDFYEVEEIDVL